MSKARVEDAQQLKLRTGIAASVREHSRIGIEKTLPARDTPTIVAGLSD